MGPKACRRRGSDKFVTLRPNFKDATPVAAQLLGHNTGKPTQGVRILNRFIF